MTNNNDQLQPNPGMRTKIFNCPHCNEAVLLRIRTEILDVVPAGATTVHSWRDNLSPEDLRVIEIAESTGVIAAFDRAVQEIKPEGRPADPAKFFISWLRTISPVFLPGFAIHRLKAEFKTKDITYWAAQGILAVIVDGSYAAFIPKRLVSGQKITMLNGGTGPNAKLPPDIPAFEQWIKTRNGYVLGQSALFNELRGKAAGEFDLGDLTARRVTRKTNEGKRQ